MPEETGIEKLRDWTKAERGRLTLISTTLGLRPPSVIKWKQVPAEHCIPLETLTGIDRHELRPDVFGAAGDAP